MSATTFSPMTQSTIVLIVCAMMFNTMAQRIIVLFMGAMAFNPMTLSTIDE